MPTIIIITPQRICCCCTTATATATATATTTTVLQPFVRDYTGELVPEG